MFGECHAHALMNGVNYREAVALHREKANEEAVRLFLEDNIPFLNIRKQRFLL